MQEGLEVIANDGVENRLVGLAPAVASSERHARRTRMALVLDLGWRCIRPAVGLDHARRAGSGKVPARSGLLSYDLGQAERAAEHRFSNGARANGAMAAASATTRTYRPTVTQVDVGVNRVRTCDSRRRPGGRDPGSVTTVPLLAEAAGRFCPSRPPGELP